MNEREIACEDLDLAIEDLRARGYRLDVIYPADDPGAAVLSRGAETVRVSRPGVPRVEDRMPGFVPQRVLTRAGADPARGRAGMLYRDLIPGRLGGRYIASHITIPHGGPVDDWVHYHHVALQIIAVRRGWVRVIYEDQGPAFVMKPGDLVLQPSGIRHRVLESSPGLEVIEISAPALHETFADHDLTLPTGENARRLFGRQRFCHHSAATTAWTSFGEAEAQETGIAQASAGIADVRMVRRGSSAIMEFARHQGELVFGFVMEGGAQLGGERLGPTDAFVVSPGEDWLLSEMSEDFRLLHVTTAALD